MAMATASRKLRVLVVDDNADTVDVTALLLRMPGVDVHTARSGTTAIQLIKASCPDVVLLDIGMPQVGGYDVAQAVHEADCANEPLLVALTGYSEPATKQRCAEVGFDLHFTKPLDFDAVRELLLVTLGEAHGLKHTHRLAVERHRAAQMALVKAQIEFAGTLLDVAATTRNAETRQRCVAKARKSCLAISRELQGDGPHDLTAGLVELQERLRLVAVGNAASE